MSDFDIGPVSETMAGSGAPSPAATPAPGAASPIADTSYRNYDGPLLTRSVRWWIVAVATLRLMRKRVGFWILAILCVLPYLWVVVQLYIRTQFPPGQEMAGGNPSASLYADMFYGVFSNPIFQFLLFLTALFVGTGSIASDNRSNALLIYLARPITREDYLLGKWTGVFLTLFGVAAAPAMVAYLYGAFALTGEGGVWASDHLLPLRLLGACAVAASVHASLLVGFSAWSKSSRIAGAVYAGFYLLSSIMAGIVGLILSQGAQGAPDLRHIAFRLSVSGIINGVAQNIFGVKVSLPIFNDQQRRPTMMEIGPPNLWAMLGAACLLIALGVLAARFKVRAVEVVKG